MKKIIALLLCAVMIIGILPVAAFAAGTAQGKCGTNATWSYDGKGVLTISGTGATYDYKDNYPDWMVYADEIKSVVVESGITKIGYGLFEDNYYITDVQLPNTLSTISHYAFSSCESLKNITIPNSVTFIGEAAFSFCKSLESFNISKNMLSLGYTPFVNCFSLKKVTVDSENPNYTVDSDGVLYNKDKSNLICAFANLSGRYKIKEGVKSISAMAFSICTEITELVIPTTLRSFEQGSLSCGRACKKITVTNGCPFYVNDAAGAVYTKNMSTLACVPSGMMGSYTVKDGTERITDWALYNCSLISEVIIPDSVKQIGEGAFSGCAIRNITIPDSVEYLGRYAFANSALTTIRFEGYVPEIGSKLFDERPITVYYPVIYSDWYNMIKEYYDDNITWISEGTLMKGDTNFDGKISNADVVFIARYLVSLVIMTDVQYAMADMNDDGMVSNSDLIAVARIVVN